MTRERGVRRSAALAAAAIVLLVALLAAGCGSDGGGDAERGGTLIDAEAPAPAIINPLVVDGTTVAAQRVVSNVLQNLLTNDETGAYVPQLAERVPTGDDIATGPLRVTFHLRPEARWSDGKPVTSQDVVFTWRTMTSDANQIASRTGWDQIRAITPGTTAGGGDCDPATCFTVAFRGDYAPWKDVFSVAGGYYVLPEHVLEGKDFDTAWNTGGIVGSGPFTLQEFTPGVRAVLARDPDWWGSKDTGGGPFLDRIVVNFLDSPAATLTALRQGEAQMASFLPDPELIGRARDIDGMTVQQVPSLFFEHVVINTRAAPMDDPAVRRALAYAIDREQIVDVLQEGSVPVLQSLLRPSQLGYEPTFARYGHDPQRAIDILEGAGWVRGPDGIFAKDGKRLEIPMSTFSGDELRRTEVRLMSEQARKAGIDLTLRSRTPDQLFGDDLTQGDFTTALLAFGGGVDPSPTALLATDQIPSEENGFSGQNVYRWSNAEVDGLLRSSDRELDDDARARQLGRIQDILADEVPLIPLYAQPNTVAHVDALKGVKENPTQAEVFWNSGEWSLSGGG
ncbi:MAG: peptide ABC transporter substrate-binding protein [Thermoleophilia bacterium]